MNDVELGGATVFPCLNVSVWPKKGLGLVWYDLKLNGAYERRSLHAACPVLKGYKWSKESFYTFLNIASKFFKNFFNLQFVISGWENEDKNF